MLVLWSSSPVSKISSVAVIQRRASVNHCLGWKLVWHFVARMVFRMVMCVHFTPRLPSLQNKSPPKPTQVKLLSSEDLISLLMHLWEGITVQWRANMFLFSVVILIEDKWFCFPNSCCYSMCSVILSSFWQIWKARQQPLSHSAFNSGLN